MTDDLDSADHSAENHHAKFHDKFKRGRFKDVLDRTKHKIAEKVREEKEARKWSSHSSKDESPSDTGIDDFLAAGRVKTSSSTHLSVFSDSASESGTPPNDRSTPPRPSTSDSKTQTSPKRVHVPRIDVSASQRFPNAKEIAPHGPVELPGSFASDNTSQGKTLLLKPEYKSRSQSASSIASASRKARIRGLSVGFANVPPVIIGEGGDEAEAPPVEISRAKMRRAKSASPQGRIPQHTSDLGADGRRPVPGRGHTDNSIDVFNPKPMSRVQTGMMPANSQANVVPNTGYDNFVPTPFKRTETGLSKTSNSPVAQSHPPLPPRSKPFIPPDLGKSQKVTHDRTRELELSLGLNPTSPHPSTSRENQEPRIFAPKPQRAPPSYDLIEGGRHESQDGQYHGPPNQQAVTQNVPPQVPHSQHIQQQPHSIQQTPPQATRSDAHQQIPQQMQYAERRQQVPQQIEHADSHQQMTMVHELPTQQLNLPSNEMLGTMRQREHGLHRVPVPPQNTEEAITQHAHMQQDTQPRQQRQYRIPEQDFGQSLELSAEQISQPDAQEQTGQMYPEFENFLRSSELQDQNSPPKPSISRFASLRSPVMRNTQNSPRQHSIPEDERPNSMEHYSSSGSKVLSQIDTSNDRSTYRPLPERSKPSSRPTSLVGSPATGSPHTQTIRRVSPLGTYESSPSNYSSAVTSPQSGMEAVPQKMRFYESINKGNPPAGFI